MKFYHWIIKIKETIHHFLLYVIHVWNAEIEAFFPYFFSRPHYTFSIKSSHFYQSKSLFRNLQEWGKPGCLRHGPGVVRSTLMAIWVARFKLICFRCKRRPRTCPRISTCSCRPTSTSSSVSSSPSRSAKEISQTYSCLLGQISQ